jgi:hypothetical protein
MNAPPARMSKALSAWAELNDRQQATLKAVFELDQAAEEAHRAAGARGQYDRAPASQWRQIDFALITPATRRRVSRQVFSTDLQHRLDAAGYDNQGNGSTMTALTARGLIRQGERDSFFGPLRTVTLTTAGRAAARAGTALPATPKAALGHRAWEVLTFLWTAGQSGGVLKWSHSTTIDNVLIGKHIPPLAEYSDEAAGYRITDRGRWFYREHWAAHAKAHPDIRAPHPDGEDAEPWPAEADDILAGHQALYRALTAAWEAACKARDTAAAETAATLPDLPGNLPADITAQAGARYELWRDTARQRTDLAAGHAGHAEARAVQAARGWAAAALAAFQAAVTGGSPLGMLQPSGDLDDWDEPRLEPPAEIGIPAIDEEARKLHAAAMGRDPAG